MQAFTSIIETVNQLAWGGLMILFIVGTGLLLSLGTRFIQFRKLGYAFKLLFSKTKAKNGDITPFQALMTSLAATIGTGNIAGVATAIVSGGPGAVFWMWVTAAVGGASKYAEALLAIRYRVTNKHGEKSGGPMYYIKKGMKDQYGSNWTWLGWLYAFFGFTASFGSGSMVQANSVAESLYSSFGVSHIVSGIAISVAAGLVIFGGIKSIARVTDKIVPAMAIIYLTGAFYILYSNAPAIPAAFGMIFRNAFSARAVGGGVLGTVIRFGVSRGVFSNEAGLGSAAIAHAASTNNDPVKQGIIGSLGSFIDTLIICTMTALVILVSGLISFNDAGGMIVSNNLTGAALTAGAFAQSLPTYGSIIVSVGLIFFAFSSILGWYYYGSKCLEFIAGVKVMRLYKLIFIGQCFTGSLLSLDLVWSLADTCNGLMALPNLIGLLTLSPLIFQMTSAFDRKNRYR